MAIGRSLFFLQLGIFVYLSIEAEAQDARPEFQKIQCLGQYQIRGIKRTCYNNCDNLNSTTEACVKPLFYGCNCMDGYVFQSATSNVCVPVSSCNVLCPPNMHFDPCITSYRKTCATRNLPSVLFKPCQPRCVCNNGYILSNAPVPVCIKIIQCLRITPVESLDIALVSKV
ncbi:alpha-tectorin-like [Hyla sarda]|uniref:alpha-tectorin-like n=1 Tax=Hyla sarda TaxID=327740 RepID=UPI0024C22A78|nr:alpha-tectorin-like [Hyla sarda]XP_056399438.1 alpha-tectorin-like [Hyla sarda]